MRLASEGEATNKVANGILLDYIFAHICFVSMIMVYKPQYCIANVSLRHSLLPGRLCRELHVFLFIR